MFFSLHWMWTAACLRQALTPHSKTRSCVCELRAENNGKTTAASEWHEKTRILFSQTHRKRQSIIEWTLKWQGREPMLNTSKQQKSNDEKTELMPMNRLAMPHSRRCRYLKTTANVPASAYSRQFYYKKPNSNKKSNAFTHTHMWKQQ